MITGNIIIPNKPIQRRLAVDEIEVLTKDMNKVTVLRLRVGFKYPCIQTKIPLLSQLLRIIT